MSLLRRGGGAARPLATRLSEVPEDEVVTCVVVFEEQTRGWTAQIAKMQTGTQFDRPYASLVTTLNIYCSMTVRPFDERGANHFDNFRRERIRLGTQDLKIAAIALANDASVLTRNTRDFARVPDLRFQDWSM